jgi:hypothetical protein
LQVVDERFYTAHAFRLTCKDAVTVFEIVTMFRGKMIPYRKLRITDKDTGNLWEDKEFTEKTGITYHIACGMARRSL